MAILNTSGAAGGGATVSGALGIANKNAGFGTTSITFTGLSVTNTPSFYMIIVLQARNSPNHTTAYYIYDNGNVKQALYEASSSGAKIIESTGDGYAWTVSFSHGECTINTPGQLATLGQYYLYYKTN